MNRALSFRDFESALAAFDSFFGWTFNVPNIKEMKVDNTFHINIYCDNDKWYKFYPDTGDIEEYENGWRH